MKKLILAAIFSIFAISLFSTSVLAVCPLCTIALGSGVGFLRALGVDDLITGIWFGALILSSFIWTIDWMDKKKIMFLFRKPLLLVIFYLVALLPLYWLKYIVYDDFFMGLDRIMFGTVIGTAIFACSVWSDKYLKKNNEDRVVIPYQRVIIPVIFLTIASTIIALLLAILA